MNVVRERLSSSAPDWMPSPKPPIKRINPNNTMQTTNPVIDISKLVRKYGKADAVNGLNIGC